MKFKNEIGKRQKNSARIKNQKKKNKEEFFYLIRKN